MIRFLSCLLILPMIVGQYGHAAGQDEPVYSGPQPGERLPSFSIIGVFGDQAEANIDLIDESKQKSLLIVFVHERTRPAFALTNAVMRFAAERKTQGLSAGIVFLTADPTETKNWLNVVRQHLPQNVLIGFSPDGQEGPGAYGLNRNVAMTVLVASEGKATANFALVQPSVEVDGPKIVQAIADVTGGGEIPPMSRLAEYARMADRTANSSTTAADQQDPNLRPLLTKLIARDATEEQVDQAAAAIIDYAEKTPVARKQIGEIAARIVAAGKLENYGTAPAQRYLKKWSEEFTRPPKAEQ